MTFDEYRKGLQLAKAEILASVQVESERVGADAAALVEDRIVLTGKKADGSSFSPYSTKPVAAFRYFGKSRNNTGEVKVRSAAKKGQGVSYRDFRAFNGLNTTPKNFQFTGEMWQGFGVVSVVQIGTGVVQVEIGGKNQRSKLLLSKHSDREKTLLSKPSEQEIQIIKKGIEQRLNAIIGKYV